MSFVLSLIFSVFQDTKKFFIRTSSNFTIVKEVKIIINIKINPCVDNFHLFINVWVSIVYFLFYLLDILLMNFLAAAGTFFAVIIQEVSRIQRPYVFYFEREKVPTHFWHLKLAPVHWKGVEGLKKKDHNVGSRRRLRNKYCDPSQNSNATLSQLSLALPLARFQTNELSRARP